VFSEFGAHPRTFPEANFPKICHNFGTFTPSPIFPKICHNFGTFTLSPNFLKIWHNFGTFTPSLIFPNIYRIFWTFPEYKLSEFLFCVSVILNLPHASVALLNSPWAHCRSVGLSVAFDTVSSECDARTEFPEPNFFPKNLPQFWDFHEYKLSLYFLLRGGRTFTTFLEILVCVSFFLNLPHAFTTRIQIHYEI